MTPHCAADAAHQTQWRAFTELELAPADLAVVVSQQAEVLMPPAETAKPWTTPTSEENVVR